MNFLDHTGDPTHKTTLSVSSFKAFLKEKSSPWRTGKLCPKAMEFGDVLKILRVDCLICFWYQNRNSG
jgi:hypothetical protein